MSNKEIPEEKDWKTIRRPEELADSDILKLFFKNNKGVLFSKHTLGAPVKKSTGAGFIDIPDATKSRDSEFSIYTGSTYYKNNYASMMLYLNNITNKSYKIIIHEFEEEKGGNSKYTYIGTHYSYIRFGIIQELDMVNGSKVHQGFYTIN